MCYAAIRSVFNYAMRILGHMGRRATTLTCSGPLKIPAPAILFFHYPFGGMNVPFI